MCPTDIYPTSVKHETAMGYNDGIPYPITVSHDGDRQRVIRDTCHHEIVGRKIRHGMHQWDRRVCEIINGTPQCDTWWDTMMIKTAMGCVNGIVPHLGTIMGYPPPAHLGSIAGRFRGQSIPWRYLMKVLHCGTWRYLMVVSHGGKRSIQLPTV